MTLCDLTGRTAIVTGGNGGIGLGIAQALIDSGARVAIWGRDEQKTNTAAAALGARGFGVVCDIADPAAVGEAMSGTLDRLGAVDACFANAGVPSVNAKFVDLSLDEWRNVIRVNLDGTFLTLQAVARHMVERGEGGSLVATSSLTAIQGAPRAESYAASKSALLGLVRALAVEFGRHGIRTNALMPGWIETGLNRELLASEPFTERVLPRVPLRRWGAPEDLGGPAVYLASEMSRYQTGDVLVIDGGFSLA